VLDSGVGGDRVHHVVKVVKGSLMGCLKVKEVTVQQVGFDLGCEAVATLNLPEPAKDYGAN